MLACCQRSDASVMENNFQNKIDNFFFKPRPIYNVALLRIIFGVLILCQGFGIMNVLDVFWSNNGVLRLDSALKYADPVGLNLFAYLPAKSWVAPALGVGLLIGALGMTLGAFTKTSIAITFLTLASFHNRNLFILNGADIIIRHFLFLLFFSPCGEALSIDMWNHRRRHGSKGIPLKRSPWVLRLMQIQFTLIYLQAFFYKLHGDTWIQGTAVYYATRIDIYFRMTMPIFNNLLLMKFLTWATLIVEFSLGTFIWIKKFRYWILFAGLLMHLSMELILNIPMFQWVMISAMVCMVIPEDLESILLRWKLIRRDYSP